MNTSGTPIHRMGPNLIEAIIGVIGCSVFAGVIAWTQFATPLSRWLVAAAIDIPLVVLAARYEWNYIEFYDEVVAVKGLFRNEVVNYASIVRVVYHPHVYGSGPVVRLWFNTGARKWRIRATQRLEGTLLPSLLELKGLKIEVR
jgi:hypothetical protein